MLLVAPPVASPVAAGPSILDFLEGAPWWVKAIAGVAAIVAPVVLPRIWPERRRGTRGEMPEADEDEDLRELRDQLVKYLQRAERAERELAIVKAEAAHLKSIVDALLERRTPPTGTQRPEP